MVHTNETKARGCGARRAMRLLIFNWKDPRNPDAGGAEVFTHEVARRWAADGHDVTLFARSFPGAAPEELIDGVQVVRRGGVYSVYGAARRWFVRQGHGRFDAVVDGVNARPFMAPRFVDLPVVALIYQIGDDVWAEEGRFPISVLGRYVFEPMWLRRYRNTPTATISGSTERDLRQHGFRDVTVIPPGVTAPPSPPMPAKEREPTLLYVGRLVRTKRPDAAIAAHCILRERIPTARLWIVGDGYLRGELERLAGAGTTFFGRVDDFTKFDLMQRAHVVLVPGVREGWGLVVLEANSSGTPAVGYRIPGLVDSIIHERTGLVVETSPNDLAAGAFRILTDSNMAASMRGEAISFAAGFSWDVTAERLLNLVRRASEGYGARRDRRNIAS